MQSKCAYSLARAMLDHLQSPSFYLIHVYTAADTCGKNIVRAAQAKLLAQSLRDCRFCSKLGNLFRSTTLRAVEHDFRVCSDTYQYDK